MRAAPMRLGGLGLGGLVLILLLGYISGSDPLQLLTDMSTQLDSGAAAPTAAPGEFARAYVLAHEVGHHVQNVTGVFDAVRDLRADRTQANDLSIRQELQADCLAGVWGYYAASRGLLEPGDVEGGLTAAAAIGDDRIQRQTQGRITPETWTHGSSAQRVEWFRRGLESGRLEACDTFGG